MSGRALVSAVYGATTHGRVFSAGNDASRWAQIESIVDHGRTTIELRLKPSAFISAGQKELLGIVAIGNGDNFFSPHAFRSAWTAKLAD